jgi:ribonuclease R
MKKRKSERGRSAGGKGLPGKDDILRYVREAQGKVGKREIAKAFGIKGGDRVALKNLLAEMSAEGSLAGGKKRVRETGALPAVSVIEVVERDSDGELVAEPVTWDDEESARPRILVLPPSRAIGEANDGALGIGDRILSRITRLEGEDVAGYRFEAEPIRRLPREKRRLLGIFRAHSRGGGTIEPVDRKVLKSWAVQKGNEGKAVDGDLVRFELVKAGRFGVPQPRIVEALGNPEDQRKISLVAIHAHGIPEDFPEGVIKEADALAPPVLAKRTDLRDLPLITIDPVDARDHDDAVHAAPDTDPANEGGWIVTVAIADVAHFVRPASRLDREAQVRGNSVYFPDRVVPMLPERISNDLCSLREGEERACLAVRMVFDVAGTKRRHTFLRGLMRSAAKLSYQEAQAAIDGAPSAKCAALLEPVLRPLWAAYAALSAARDRRAPLDLDLPERRIELDAAGRVARVYVPERLAAHRLIEEFMIQANVAAAEMLEERRTVCVYRVHEPPSKEKLKSLRDFLDTLGLKLPPGAQLKPGHFNQVLAQAKSLPVPELVNEVVLRSQAQAVYRIENAGHFGLNLMRYAHFTSPIRRYADLVVHRALIRACKLGDGGLDDEEVPRLADVAEQISQAERRAMAAERETIDRLIAAHLADRIGAEFDARISGVVKFGLFVRLKETGADGFVPAATLGTEFYRFADESHALVGDRSGLAFRLGDDVRVKLVEAVPMAGALRFDMISDGKPMHASLMKGWRGKRLPKGRRPRR